MAAGAGPAAFRHASDSEPVYDRILVGHVDSEHGDDAVALGADLARLTGGSLLLATVVPAVFIEHLGERSGTAIVHGGARERATAALHAAAERVAGTPGIDHLERRLEASSSPARGLHDLAEAEGGDLIVLGASHRSAAGRVFLGSVPERLLHGAPCAVAVAPAGHAARADRAVRVVGVGFDGSPESRSALARAHELAARAGARLRVLTVLDPLPRVLENWAPLPGLEHQGEIEWEDAVERQRAGAAQAVEAAVAALGDGVVDVETGMLAGDDVAATLLDATTAGDVDLLVLGSRAYGPAHRTLGGSVSVAVLRHATVPVVVVPRGAAG